MIRHNLLEYQWSASELLPFFFGQKVALWFNQSAPQIKSGKLDIRGLEPKEALNLLLENPILIRRPLLRQGAKHLAGFDLFQVEEIFGIPLSMLARIEDPSLFAEEFILCKEKNACP